MTKDKITVLFLCSHNTGRSQMAEGYLNFRYGDRYNAVSAGFKKSSINPCTVRVMAEIGVNIAAHRSKAVSEYMDETFDFSVILTRKPHGNDILYPVAKTPIYQEFRNPGLSKDPKGKFLPGSGWSGTILLHGLMHILALYSKSEFGTFIHKC
jgi:arsenate reductase (thioredoxin)